MIRRILVLLLLILAPWAALCKFVVPRRTFGGQIGMFHVERLFSNRPRLAMFHVEHPGQAASLQDG